MTYDTYCFQIDLKKPEPILYFLSALSFAHHLSAFLHSVFSIFPSLCLLFDFLCFHSALLPSTLLSLFFFSFFALSDLFSPFLSHPVISPHCSHLSIYAYFCHVLRSPLTLSFPHSFSFPLFLPCAFLYLSFALSLDQLSLSLANHYSFSFVSSDASALFCKLNPPTLSPPSPPLPSLPPFTLRSLFFLIALFQWQGGAAGLAPHCYCRHTAGL